MQLNVMAINEGNDSSCRQSQQLEAMKTVEHSKGSKKAMKIAGGC